MKPNKTTKMKKSKFKIEKHPMIGKRSSCDLQTRDQIKKTMMMLPRRTEHSFFISSVIIKDQRQARGLVQTIKKEIRKEFKSTKDYDFSCRTIVDENKKYQGTRIWRTN